ncbi:MAG: hypothetical protein ACOC5R_05605, partial [Elusimicrobiota bacterium]
PRSTHCISSAASDVYKETDPKDLGIEILTGDLTKNSVASFLPEQLVIEQSKIFQPASWAKDEMKLIVVYQLFYPEKGKEKELLFFPEVEEQEGFKVRFKVVYDGEENKVRKDVEVYELEVSQFAEGVRSTLTRTSYQPRDDKKIFGNFFIRHWLALIIGLVIIGIAVYIPARYLVGLVANKQTEKELSLQDVLEIEHKRLNRLNKLSDNSQLINQLCLAIRRLIMIKTGMKTMSMTATEIKQKVKSEDIRIVKLANMLRKYDQARYSAKRINTRSVKKTVDSIEQIVVGWVEPLNSARWQVKAENIFWEYVEKITKAWRRCKRWIS